MPFGPECIQANGGLFCIISYIVKSDFTVQWEIVSAEDAGVEIGGYFLDFYSWDTETNWWKAIDHGRKMY